ncbi:DUF1636 domain-containing protein [Thalassospira profundimaris]|nr:hypothetical protein TH2_03815 [Thalassospira profundimaris WP0211]
MRPRVVLPVTSPDKITRMTAKSRLNICTTCTSSTASAPSDPRDGQTLFERIQEVCATRDLPFEVKPVECLTNCKSGCSVALNGSGKWGYVYGNVDPDSMVENLCELASKYAESEKGIVAWRERPDALRRNVIARIPPID